MANCAVLVIVTSLVIKLSEGYFYEYPYDDFFEGPYNEGEDVYENRIMAKPQAEEIGGNFEGDMIISSELRGILEYGPRNGLLDRFRWPKNKKGHVIVPYSYQRKRDFSKDQRAFIRDALNEIEQVTCVKFIETRKANDLVMIQRGRGCSSSVGRQGGAQKLTLETKKCFKSKGIIMHEFIHALGFFHMQSAYDRDNYIRIINKNIIPRNRFNFNKYSNRHISYYGTSYDFDSLMHYSAKAFSMNGEDTIKARDPSNQDRIGRRSKMSEGDIERINNMYKCNNDDESFK